MHQRIESQTESAGYRGRSRTVAAENGNPARHLNDDLRVDPPHGRRSSRRNRRGAPGPSYVVTWITIGVLATLFALRFFVPPMLEEFAYSNRRGAMRADYDTAGEHLGRSPLVQLSRAHQLVSKRIAPSVVDISTEQLRNGDAADTGPLSADADNWSLKGQGSGVLLDHEGYILTNYHVIRDAGRIDVRLSDGRARKAQVVGYDAMTDLAVLKIEADRLTPAEWGDSDAADVGSLVWAFGSPFGLEQTMTFGILSAKERRGLGPKRAQQYLDTDAAVNPGNSGGPLVDAKGRVIGINTAIVGKSYRGISFAVPSSVARPIFEQLKARGRVVRGWLGVALEPVTAERAQAVGAASRQGAYVIDVVHDARGPSPAQRAGIRVGDIVVAWNDKLIDAPATLSMLVARTRPGEKATVRVLRRGKPLVLHVIVGERPV